MYAWSVQEQKGGLVAGAEVWRHEVRKAPGPQITWGPAGLFKDLDFYMEQNGELLRGSGERRDQT